MRPTLDYVGGIAEATMTWDGTSFQNLTLAPAAGTALPAAVSIAPFSRPAEVSDDAALQLVRSGFHDCVTIRITPSATTPPNCPNGGPMLDPYFGDLQWVLSDDPVQGALVSFDTDNGSFAVTGSFTMTLHTVRHAERQDYKTAGNYTATLVWDGHQLNLVKIEGA